MWETDREKLLSWSKKQAQDLPWRNQRTLYTTLVSEIMLQQTTASTVANRFPQFIEKFPSIKKLAKASLEDVLSAWQGLGYYRRARNLKKAAEAIQTEYKGEIPLDKKKLLCIPGIGEYTANALLSIGANQKALAIDANIERVSARYYGLTQEKGGALSKELERGFSTGEYWSGLRRYRALNEALMDVGRIYCQARKADCLLCPLSSSCVSKAKGSPLKFPKIKDKQTKKFQLILWRFFIQNSKGEFLVVQRQKGTWLEGQYELPSFVKFSEDPKLKQYPFIEQSFKPEFMLKSSITKYKIENIVVCLSQKEAEKTFKKKYLNEPEWISSKENLNLTSVTRKILNRTIS